MNRYLLSIIFGCFCTGILPAYASGRLQTSATEETQACMSGWVETLSYEAETGRCIKATNCTDNASFEITNTDCPSFMEVSTSGIPDEKQSIGLAFKTGEKEYNIQPEAVADGQEDTGHWYHLFWYILHSYEIANKAYQIHNKGLSMHHAKFMAYYLVGALVHSTKTPLLLALNNISWLAPKLLFAGMTIGAGVAFKYDCACGTGGCCRTRTPFQKIYTWINPHSAMMVMSALAVMGFPR